MEKKIQELLNLRLVRAVKDEDLDAVESLIKIGADANTVDDKGGTALMVASCRGYIEIGRVLIENGADVNAKDERGITALMLACDDGDLEMVNLLIENGADIEARTNETGLTALMCAGYHFNTKVVKWLKEKGADINAMDRYGRTAYRFVKENTSDGYKHKEKQTILSLLEPKIKSIDDGKGGK